MLKKILLWFKTVSYVCLQQLNLTNQCIFLLVVQRIDLSPFSEEECINLLLRKGFFKKEDASTEVPEKYLNGPYVPVKSGEEKQEL